MKTASQPIQITENITRWMMHGERGTSSDTIVGFLTGIGCRGYMSHPLDPDDFRRCVLLLEAAPELRTALPMMAEASPVLAALVDHWAAIEESLSAEVPAFKTGGYGRAQKTYQMMKELGC